MKHTVLVYDPPEEYFDSEGWPRIPEFLSQSVQCYYRLGEMDDYDRDMLAAMAERPDLFEILYWAGDVAR